MRKRFPIELLEGIDLSLGYTHALAVVVDESRYVVKFSSKYSYLTPKDVASLFKKLKKDIAKLKNLSIDQKLFDVLVEKVIKADVAEEFTEVYFHPSDKRIHPTSVHIINLDRNYVITVSDGAVIAIDFDLKYVEVNPRTRSIDEKWRVEELTENYAGETVKLNERMVSEARSIVERLEDRLRQGVKVKT